LVCTVPFSTSALLLPWRRGFSLSSPTRLASPSWVRKRDSFLECWEEGVRASPAVCARKKESSLLQSRILTKRLHLVMAEDGMSLQKMGYRRSARLMGPGLPSVAEIESSAGELTEMAEGASPLIWAFDVLGDGQGRDPSSSGTALGNDSMDSSAMLPDGVALIDGDAQVSFVCSSLVTESLVEVPIGLADVEVADLVGLGSDSFSVPVLGNSALASEESSGDAMLLGNVQEVLHTAMVDLVVVDSVKEGGEPGQAGGVGAVLQHDDGVVVGDPVEDGQQVKLAMGAALRLPSIDGRQQRSSQPVDSSCPLAGAGHMDRVVLRWLWGRVGCGFLIVIVTTMVRMGLEIRVGALLAMGWVDLTPQLSGRTGVPMCDFILCRR
ncbi:hypothetical protein Dimus_033559, partial [Dionaea muscipula]